MYGDPLIHPQVETYFGNVNPIGLRSCYDEGACGPVCARIFVWLYLFVAVSLYEISEWLYLYVVVPVSLCVHLCVAVPLCVHLCVAVYLCGCLCRMPISVYVAVAVLVRAIWVLVCVFLCRFPSMMCPCISGFVVLLIWPCRLLVSSDPLTIASLGFYCCNCCCLCRQAHLGDDGCGVRARGLRAG